MTPKETNIKEYVDDMISLEVLGWLSKPQNMDKLTHALEKAFDKVMQDKLEPINKTINALIIAFTVMTGVQMITLAVLIWHIVVK
jgi:YesN/AraC family two-component response regulator